MRVSCSRGSAPQFCSEVEESHLILKNISSFSSLSSSLSASRLILKIFLILADLPRYFSWLHLLSSWVLIFSSSASPDPTHTSCSTPTLPSWRMITQSFFLILSTLLMILIQKKSEHCAWVLDDSCPCLVLDEHQH